MTLKIGNSRVLVCNCEGTMPLDSDKIAKACGVAADRDINSHLCRSQLENFEAALRGEDSVLVACTQEAPLFAEIAEELDVDTPLTFVNIRENAGWSESARETMPKIAALLSEAVQVVRPAATVTMESAGDCLVYGPGAQTMDAALRLAGTLNVTLLLTDAADILPPPAFEMAVFKGQITTATGHLGAFDVTVAGLAPLSVSSRGSLAFGPAQKEKVERYDLILDLTGGSPLFTGHERRDGYVRPDPGDPVAVERSLADISGLVGEFEKPRYVEFRADLCAHSRSVRIGCTRCLDACPAGAITSAGDAVEIDPFVCGGCGMCHSVCPTGAAAYAMPSAGDLLSRLRTLLTAYEKAGGAAPILLIHDTSFGTEMISAMAGHGRGLPAHVMPFSVNRATQTGFDLLANAGAYGAAGITILTDPKRADEMTALVGQVAMANAMFEGLGYDARVRIICEADPDRVEADLWSIETGTRAVPATYLPQGDKRGVQRLALSHLHRNAPVPADIIGLPGGASLGAVSVNVEGCTLCLACVGVCPTGAMLDNPDAPQLRFTEDACVQCGLCANTCPESVITLDPRLNFTDAASRPALIKEEEPAKCVRCGNAFGTQSSVDRVVEQLAGKHSMFERPEMANIMRMCADCRVVAQMELNVDPLAGGPRPTTRVTDYYIREREEIEAARDRFKAGETDGES